MTTMFEQSSLTTEEKMSARVRAMVDETCARLGFGPKTEEALVEQFRCLPELTDYCLRATARSEVRLAMTMQRQRIVGQEETVDDRRGSAPKVYGKDLGAHVAQLGGKYLSWPLSNRKLLRDATVLEVKSEAEMYEANAMGNARNGRFMRLVARKMEALGATAKDTAGKLLSDDDLRRLMKAASKSVGTTRREQ